MKLTKQEVVDNLFGFRACLAHLRRLFGSQGLLLRSWSAALLTFGLTCAANAAGQPNIILILADDLEVAPVGHMWWTKTQVRQQGTEFQRAYVSVPLCAPSRATILTGKYPQNNGVYTQNHADYYGHENPANSLPVWLKQAGYRTGFVGKYMNNYAKPEPNTHIPPGWDVWHARYAAGPHYDGQYGYWLNENGVTRQYGTRTTDYATDVYRDKALAFVTEAVGAGSPFFLELAVHAPHNPYVPAPRHASTHPTVKAPRPLSFNEADVSDKPAYVQGRARLTSAKVGELDNGYRNRVRMLQAVDETVKRILDLLAARNQLANTYVIFSSDNGWVMGPHRFTGTKGVPYEEAVRVPMFIRGPGVAAGARLPHLVGNVDLAPTIAELAGVPVPHDVDGRSLVPLLSAGRPSPEAWRQAFPISFRESTTVPGVPSWQGLRTAQLTYVEYPLTGERELYDNIADPSQLLNIAGSADPTLLAALSERAQALSGCARAACSAAEDLPLPLP